MAKKKSTRAKNKTEEHKIQKAIIEALNQLGFSVWRTNSGVIFLPGRAVQLAPSGTPDILGYDAEGKFVALEVKLPGKKPSKNQKAWIAKARASGCDVDVVHSLDESLGWAAKHYGS